MGRSAVAAAAHGIAAMRLGRLDSETTANVGTIVGGTNANVVPEHCRVEAEARSLDRSRAETVATEIVDHFQEAADAGECDLDITVERMFDGYRTSPREPQVVLAERALRACGYEPTHIATGGGSDANALQAAGFPCTNLANGTERNHEPTERVSVDALEGMLEVAIALFEQAPAVLGELPERR
jgi:tripeptide aminopeptidase